MAESGTPSLESVYRDHHDFVWRSLRGLGVYGTATDDAAQDVFLIAQRRLPTYDPDKGSLRAWLFGLARMVSRKHADRTAKTKQRSGATDPEAVAGGPSTHRLSARPDRVVARVEAATLVEEFMESLDEDQRAIFFLKEAEGMSAPEIAAAVGINLNTAYSRLRLARKRFDAFVARRKAMAEREDRDD